MKTKIFYLSAIAVLFGILFCGCKQDSGNSSSGTETAETATNPFLGIWITSEAVQIGEDEWGFQKYEFGEFNVSVYYQLAWESGWTFMEADPYTWSGKTAKVGDVTLTANNGVISTSEGYSLLKQ